MKKIALFALMGIITVGCTEENKKVVSKNSLYEVVTKSGVDTVKADKYYLTKFEDYVVFEEKVSLGWDEVCTYPTKLVKRIRKITPKNN